MSNYIISARNQNCFNYPTINQHKNDFFNHLFFTNGNGVEFNDGNPIVGFQYGNWVYWQDFYKHSFSFEDIRTEYFDRYFEYDLEKSYNIVSDIKCRLQGGELNDRMVDDVWEEVRKDQLLNIDNIQELTIEDLTDDQFWFEQLVNCEYLPRLGLSEGYFKAQQLNDNSETLLVKTAMSLSRANIVFAEKVLRGEVDVTKYENSYEFGKVKALDDNMVKSYEKDINLLEKLIKNNS